MCRRSQGPGVTCKTRYGGTARAQQGKQPRLFILHIIGTHISHGTRCTWEGSDQQSVSGRRLQPKPQEQFIRHGPSSKSTTLLFCSHGWANQGEAHEENNRKGVVSKVHNDGKAKYLNGVTGQRRLERPRCSLSLHTFCSMLCCRRCKTTLYGAISLFSQQVIRVDQGTCNATCRVKAQLLVLVLADGSNTGFYLH